jgi:hypothetical protein
MNGQKRNVNRILVERREGRRPLGRQRHGWMDNIKMDLGENGMVLTGLAWLRIVTSGELL